MARLAPRIAENEDIICSDAQHDEDRHLVQGCVHRDAADASVDEVGDGKRHDDKHHGRDGHAQAFKVEPDVEQHEHDAKNSICHVTPQNSLEVLIEE